MVDSAMHNVWIQVTRNGLLNMVWNNQVMFTNLYLGGWVPTQGQFALGAGTGGSCEEVIIGSLSITTTVAPATPVAASVTTPPQNVTVNEVSSATFGLVFDGDAPITLQWTENSADILNATNPVLTLTQVSYNSNGAKIACKVSNASGSLTSQAATLTVIKDTTPPTVTNAVADITFTNIVVSFDKPVSATALVASNYKVSSSITVLSVISVDQDTVELATSKMFPSRWHLYRHDQQRAGYRGHAEHYRPQHADPKSRPLII